MLGRWASRAAVCYAITAIVIAAVLYPLSYSKTEDSFPLSSFPMFARRVPTATLTQHFVIAIGQGFRRSISPDLIGTEEVLQAQATIRRAVHGGRRAVRKLCQEVAARIAGDESFAAATAVRVVKGRYHAVNYLTGRDKTGVETTIYNCRIER